MIVYLKNDVNDTYFSEFIQGINKIMYVERFCKLPHESMVVFFLQKSSLQVGSEYKHTLSLSLILYQFKEEWVSSLLPKVGLRTNNGPWELVRNAGSWVPFQICRIGIYILTRSAKTLVYLRIKLDVPFPVLAFSPCLFELDKSHFIGSHIHVQIMYI